MKKRHIGIIGIVIIGGISAWIIFGGKFTNASLQTVIEPTYIIDVKTSEGVMTFQLFNDKAPKTVQNFITLSEEGFYDGSRFHRVIKDFVVQGGDPLSKDLSLRLTWGEGGPGYTIEDEIYEGNSNVFGTIAMANNGRADTGGSQFFINLEDNQYLDQFHTVFGTLIQGKDVLRAISEIETNEIDQPTTDVIVYSITLRD